MLDNKVKNGQKFLEILESSIWDLNRNLNQNDTTSISLLSKFDLDDVKIFISYIKQNQDILLDEISKKFQMDESEVYQIIKELLDRREIEGYLICKKRFIYFPKKKLDQFCGVIRNYCVNNYMSVYMNSFIELLSLKTKKKSK